MTVKVLSDGPAIVMVCACAKCGYLLEFTFEDVQTHRVDNDGDAVEDRGLYLLCPRSSCCYRNWLGHDRAAVYAHVATRARDVVIARPTHPLSVEKNGPTFVRVT